MDVFEVHERLIADHPCFTSGSAQIRNERIAAYVEQQLGNGIQWPDPWLSLNPSLQSGGTITELVAEGLLDPEHERILGVKRIQSDPWPKAQSPMNPPSVDKSGTCCGCWPSSQAILHDDGRAMSIQDIFRA